MQRRGALLAIGELILLGVLLAGCTPGQGSSSKPTPAPTATISEALRFDAEHMAEEMGIPVEEAIRRAGLQDLIGELNAELQQREAATFAGLWIQNEPEYRVVVAFTRDGKRTLQPYVKDTPLDGLIDLRTARFSLAQLEAIYAQATRELGKLDFDVNVFLSVDNNRVEVPVADRAWFEGELQRVGAHLPEEVEMVIVEGGSTARDKDLLLTPPVPGIAFPRQKPVEGLRECLLALLTGTLTLEGECLKVQSPGGGLLLPVWPPEFTLRAEGGQVLVIDGEGQVAARVGEEVCMGGGYVGITDEWVLQQIPAACRGEYFAVGCDVRPSLRFDSDLFALDVVSTPEQTALFLRYKPALSEQAPDGKQVAGTLVAYDERRCLNLQSDSYAGPVNLLWPMDWSLRAGDGELAVVDGTGQAVARVGDEVSLRVREVPSNWDLAVYRQLVDELPCDCIGGPSWLVSGVE